MRGQVLLFWPLLVGVWVCQLKNEVQLDVYGRRTLAMSNEEIVGMEISAHIKHYRDSRYSRARFISVVTSPIEG